MLRMVELSYWRWGSLISRINHSLNGLLFTTGDHYLYTIHTVKQSLKLSREHSGKMLKYLCSGHTICPSNSSPGNYPKEIIRWETKLNLQRCGSPFYTIIRKHKEKIKTVYPSKRRLVKLEMAFKHWDMSYKNIWNLYPSFKHLSIWQHKALIPKGSYWLELTRVTLGHIFSTVTWFPVLLMLHTACLSMLLAWFLSAFEFVNPDVEESCWS